MPVPRSIFILLLCLGCIEPYRPPINPSAFTSLVVDAYINVDGSASVKLSRSVSLTENDDIPWERGAIVTIESASGSVFSLDEGEQGTYTASGLAVDLDDKFVLHIQTTDGHEYRSDEVLVYPTPPVDNIFFDIPNARDHIDVRIDANDPNPNATGYYLWDCIETYQYHSPVFAGFKIVNRQPIEREPDELVYMCYRNVIKPSVMLDANYLSENLISSQKVAGIDKESEKISVRYSILVKQRAISEAEYDFRVQLQNSTEQQGTLFSVIPGAVVGNVHPITDPGEYVLGYFRAQDVKEKRFFIERSQLPEDFLVSPSKMGCQPEETCPVGGGGFNCVRVEDLSSNALVTTANTDGRGVILSYNFVNSTCGDCRIAGGDTAKPPFW